MLPFPSAFDQLSRVLVSHGVPLSPQGLCICDTPDCSGGILKKKSQKKSIVIFLGNIHIGTETLGNRSFRNREPGNREPVPGNHTGGTRELVPGDRFPGSRVVPPVVPRYWVLGTGYWVLGTGYWVLGTGYWVLGTGYWVLGTGYWVLVREGTLTAYRLR